METARIVTTLLCAISVGMLFPACHSSGLGKKGSTMPDGGLRSDARTGGTSGTGTGGATSGGTTETGGVTNSGGATGSGGVAGAGGVMNTGGLAGAGGGAEGGGGSGGVSGGTGGEIVDSATDSGDAALESTAPIDTESADGPGDDAAVSPCGLPVTGSCLFGDCDDYTDVDTSAAMSGCASPSSWSTQPCQDHFTFGCRFGTPGTAGCRVRWITTGGVQLVDCVTYGGVIVYP
jgi:hypothetical protein